MKMRYISTKFWSDGYTSNLDPVEKLLFIYFFTNERVTLAGAYELPLKVAAAETGIDREMIEKILRRFSEDRKIFYIDGWIIVRNFCKYQSTSNPKIRKAINDAAEKIPKEVIDKLKADYGVSIAYPSPMDGQSHLDSDSDKDSNVDVVAPSKEKDTFIKQCEKHIFPLLKEVRGYPFDKGKDASMLWDLKQYYEEKSLTAIITKWVLHVAHVRPLTASDDPRSQIMRWVAASCSRDELAE